MADLTYPEEKFEELQDDREKSKSPIRNINKWSIIFVWLTSMLLSFLNMTYGGPNYYYLIIIGTAIGILYLLANQTPTTGYIDGTEAEIIGVQETKVKRMVENLYGITITEGLLKSTGTWLHLSPWDGRPFFYETGYKTVRPNESEYYFTVRVDALRNGIGYMGWSPKEKPYTGENYIIKRQVVPVSDVRFYKSVPNIEISGM